MIRLEVTQLPKCSGIYMIKNTVNNKVYIGSSVNLNRRIKKHFYEIKKKFHHNKHLEKAVHKYGVENFEIYLLEVFDIITDNKLRKIEESFIEKYDSYKKGYNQLENKQSHLTRLNKSKNHIDNNKKLQSKAVIMFDKKTGDKLKEFPSVSDASRYLGTSSTNISHACKNVPHISILGHTFCYKNEYDINQNYSFQKRKIVWSEETKLKRAKSSIRSKKTYQYDLNWNLVQIYHSRSFAEKQNSFKKEALRTKVNKETPFEGYYWTHNKIEDIV